MDRRTGSPTEAEAWLPNGAARRPGKLRRAGSGQGTQPEDWLPAGAAPEANRQPLVALPGLGPAGREDEKDTAESPPGSEVEAATPDAEQLGALERQVARLETVIAGQAERLERQQDAIAHLGLTRADASLELEPTPRWSAIDGFDPNAVGATELLRLGLSKTQTARFLARREQLDGFSSVEEFDELRGFPADLRDKLKAAARISA